MSVRAFGGQHARAGCGSQGLFAPHAPGDTHTNVSETHSSSGPGRLPPEKAAKITRTAARLSVATAIVLTIIKLIAWVMSDSVGMLSSLADSALDLTASAVTLFAIGYAATPPDAEHRFGHGKAEGFASLFQAMLVLVSATLVAREAVGRLIDPEPVQHSGLAMGVMVISIILTTILIRAQTRAVAKTGSVAVAGDRAHYMSDLLANAAVIVGIGVAAFTGFERADALAGLAVALWLGWAAYEVFRGSWDLLMDRELPDAARAHIFELAADDNRLLGVHQLRTRAMGPGVQIQFHADLDPDLSLEAAHRIIVAAERRIMAEYPGADVLIHADPKGRAEPHGQESLRALGQKGEDSA